MVYVRNPTTVGYYYGLWDDRTGERRKNIISDAVKEAETEVKSGYPYAVYRSLQEVVHQAERMFQQWIAILNKDAEHRTWVKEEWFSSINEMRHPYTSAFIGKYLEAVAEEDKKAGKQPTFPSATSPTGATIIVTNVDRSNPNAYVYYVELVDPEYIDGVFQPEPLTVVLEPESSSSNSGLASSFSDTTRASASSDTIPSRVQQRGRKPIRSHWGKQ